MPWEPNPARDANGHVLPHDDPNLVPNDFPLLRHIHPDQWAPDDRGGYRPQSNAFMFSSDGSGSMSVDIEPPMTEAGLQPTHYAFQESKGVVRITAGTARRLGMRMGPEPIPERNPHHGGIWQPNSAVSQNELNKRRRQLSWEAEESPCPLVASLSGEPSRLSCPTV